MFNSQHREPHPLGTQVNIAVMATVKGGKRTLLPLLARAEWHMHHGSIGASAIRHLQYLHRPPMCRVGAATK